MTEVKFGEKTYSLGYTMLSIVRAKALTGKGFFEVATSEQLESEHAFEKVLALLLLGLQTKHADEFKTVDDVAAALPDMATIAAATPAINAELQRFLAIDASFQKQAADAQNSEAKKKSRSTPSPKTSTAPSAA